MTCSPELLTWTVMLGAEGRKGKLRGGLVNALLPLILNVSKTADLENTRHIHCNGVEAVKLREKALSQNFLDVKPYCV